MLKRNLTDPRFFDTPSPVDFVHIDDTAEFNSGYFADI